MIKIRFRNLKRSELAQSVVLHRFKSLAAKFEALERSKVTVTLEMENSPIKSGPDLFRVKVMISKGLYDGIQCEKESDNLYVALADVIEHMLEVLNRCGDRIRARDRKEAREHAKQIQESSFKTLKPAFST